MVQDRKETKRLIETIQSGQVSQPEPNPWKNLKPKEEEEEASGSDEDDQSERDSDDQEENYWNTFTNMCAIM